MEEEEAPTDKHRNRTEFHRTFSVLSVKFQWISVGKEKVPSEFRDLSA